MRYSKKISNFAAFFQIKNIKKMTEKERQNLLAFMDDFISKAAFNKELALDFLNRAGICTKEGNLSAPYKHLYVPPLQAV